MSVDLLLSLMVLFVCMIVAFFFGFFMLVLMAMAVTAYLSVHVSVAMTACLSVHVRVAMTLILCSVSALISMHMSRVSSKCTYLIINMVRMTVTA